MTVYQFFNKPRPVEFHVALMAGLIGFGYWLGKR
jgi:hypothetical protein